MNLTTFASDLSTLWWNIFNYCHVESFIQSLGQIMSNTGIAGSFLIAVITEVYNYFNDDIPNSWFLMIEDECKKSLTNVALTDQQW